MPAHGTIQLSPFFNSCTVKLNGNRVVTGVLRGFDPYMNLVLDEAVEERTATQKFKIGMVVSMACCLCPVLRLMSFVLKSCGTLLCYVWLQREYALRTTVLNKCSPTTSI